MTTPALSYSEARAAGSWATLRRLFGVDVRSLAAFRIGLGVLVALDLAARFPLIEALYTDQGLVPRDLMPVGFLSRTPLDLYGFDGSCAWALALLALTFSCSVLFAIGFRTRWVTVALWVLMSALFRRNQLATDGGDSVVRCLLFWSMFLPLGAAWSIDARGRAAPPSVVCSPATAALLLQPALLYFMAGLAKDTPPWREGYAVSLALNETEWVKPLGVWLGQHPSLVRVMTFATRTVEIGAPLLLFLPIFTSRARAVAIASLVALQVGLATTLRLNFFPFYSSVAWLAFVPSSLWDRLSQRPEVVSRASIASEPAPFWQTHLHRARGALVLGALCLGTVVGFRRADEPDLADRAALSLGFAQQWNMYRDIGEDYVRIHVEGRLADGAVVDLRTDQGHLTDSPLEDWVRSYRGAVFIEAMKGGDPEILQAFSRYVCSRWNSGRQERAELVELTLTPRVVRQHVPRAVLEGPVRHERCDRAR
jgi:hypothetical protein